MQDKYYMFQNRLTKVYRHLSKTAKRLNVTCYRIYDHDLPEFPFLIEIFQDNLYVSEYKRNHNLREAEYQQWLETSKEIIGEVTGIHVNNIYLRLRQRKQGRQGQYQSAVGSGHSAVGSGQSAIVNENGLKFIINLTDYLDTGLF